MTWLRGFRRVLIVAAHPDDELACGGAIHQLVGLGAEVHYLAFSRCTASLPPGCEADVLVQEARASCAALGVDPARVAVDDLPVRHYPAHRQEILERLVALQRAHDFDLVFVPSSTDTHQDHAVVSAEGFRAFKRRSVLGYHHLQNQRVQRSELFVTLSEADLAAKVAAANCYASQAHRPYGRAENLRAATRLHGIQCGAELAEGFEVMRLIAPAP